MSKKIVGIDIDARDIKVVQLEKKRGTGIYLTKISGISTPKDAIRNGEIINIDEMVKALNQVLKSAKITAKEAIISFSGKGTVIQQFTFPKMNPSELKEAVRGELEKYSVLSPDDLIFDYQPLSEVSKKGLRKIRVFCVGISNKIFYSYISCIQKLNLQIGAVDVDPLSAASSLYKEVSKDIPTAIVGIRDEVSYITILRKGKFDLFYCADIGTAQLLNSSVSPCFNETALTDLVRELEKSFRFYSIEFQKEEVKKIFLYWNNSKLPDLNEKLSSMLPETLELKAANPLENIKYSTSLITEEIKEKIPAFTVAIGAGMRGFKRTGHNISTNLLGIFIPQAKRVRKALIFLILFCLTLGLCTFFIFNYQQRQIEFFNRQINNKEIQIRNFELQLTELKSIKKMHQQIRERINRQSLFLKRLNQVSWSMILSEVTQLLPKDVWLTSFGSDEQGHIILEGYTFSVDQVAQLIKELNKISKFDEVKLNSFQQKKVIQKAKSNVKEYELIKFKLETALKKEEGKINE